MRSLVARLVITVVLGLSLACGAAALTLDQGTYRLQWQATNPMQDHSSYASGVITAMSKEAAKSYQGLASARCYSGEVGECFVILDESKGTGKGYDTAFLLRRSDKEKDLSKAVKLSLTAEGSARKCEDVKVDIQLGDGESLATKQATVSFWAYGATNGNADLEEIYINLSVSGCWVGIIGSDTGPLEIALCDVNSNGVFGDFVNPGKGDFPQPGDGIQVRKKNADPRRGWEPIYLSRVVCYGNKLYTMKASKLGDTLEIRPYAGETGKLKFEAKDASGKPLQCGEAYVFGDNGLYKVDTGYAAALPPGTYKCPYVMVLTSVKSKKTPFGFAIQPKSTIKINANKESIIKLGGLIKVAIEPDLKEIVARQGQRKQIDLEFFVGSDKVRALTSSREATVTIKDSKGKQVWSGTAGFG